MPSREVLKELQEECLADDVELPENADAWTVSEAREYFESGGTSRPGQPASVPAADEEESCLQIRWAVDTAEWDPQEAEWEVLLRTLPEEEATRVMKFHFRDDQKRALVSRLLQRHACARYLSLPHGEVQILRTKGRKPYLASPHSSPLEEAPNWNFNVSHEGSFVILASEPTLLCGADVAAPSQLRRGRQQTVEDLFEVMRDNFTKAEWAQVRAAGPEEAAMATVFRKLWSLKEAYTKARGDGLGFKFSRCEFALGGGHPARGEPHKKVELASVRVDGAARPEWRFYIQSLRDDHMVSIARGPPAAAVDALGGFTATFRQRDVSEEQMREGHAKPEPLFSMVRVEDLLPAEAREEVLQARRV